MATQRTIDSRDGLHAESLIGTTDERGTRDLLKQLANEGSELFRNEMSLAKLEMRDMAREVALDSAKLGSALGLTLIGGLALVTAAIIGLGHLLDGRFGLSALIIGVLFLVVGGIMAKAGINGLRERSGPEQTIQSLKRNKEWARREVREFKEEIRS
ncbi:MAG TPA: phage holin family protein [Longimicrobiales bacterium]|nr:phage holin family protein [Longimicrobiales bacterium]